VVIKLSDAEGNSLKIQPLNICYNGIEQTVYFLCSTPQDADDD
jgi:hypothetical protein